MGGLRIRWRAAGRGIVAITVAVLALQAVPSLLKPPAPPPLADDIGLPQPPSGNRRRSTTPASPAWSSSVRSSSDRPSMRRPSKERGRSRQRPEDRPRRQTGERRWRGRKRRPHGLRHPVARPARTDGAKAMRGSSKPPGAVGRPPKPAPLPSTRPPAAPPSPTATAPPSPTPAAASPSDGSEEFAPR